MSGRWCLVCYNLFHLYLGEGKWPTWWLAGLPVSRFNRYALLRCGRPYHCYFYVRYYGFSFIRFRSSLGGHYLVYYNSSHAYRGWNRRMRLATSPTVTPVVVYYASSSGSSGGTRCGGSRGNYYLHGVAAVANANAGFCIQQRGRAACGHQCAWPLHANRVYYAALYSSYARHSWSRWPHRPTCGRSFVRSRAISNGYGRCWKTSSSRRGYRATPALNSAASRRSARVSPSSYSPGSTRYATTITSRPIYRCFGSTTGCWSYSAPLNRLTSCYARHTGPNAVASGRITYRVHGR